MNDIPKNEYELARDASLGCLLTGAILAGYGLIGYALVTALLSLTD